MTKYLCAILATAALALSVSAQRYELVPQAPISIPVQDCAGLFVAPTVGTEQATGGGGGDGVGSLPNAATNSVATTSLNCAAHPGETEKVETPRTTGESPSAWSKRHELAVQVRKDQGHPAAVGPASPFPFGQRFSSDPYATFWRTPLDSGFALTGVRSTPGTGEPEWLTKKRHEACVIALAVEMPAL